MTDPAGKWHPFGRTRQEDLNILANGGETGWWDDNGRPTPWPEDFLNPEAGWTNGNDNNLDVNPADDDPKNPPF
jgi:hypothetical protein